jgi:subtilase family serine protease
MTDQDRTVATRPIRAAQLSLEQLESRLVPSLTTAAILSTPQSVAFYGGLTPSQVRHAYGFDRISFHGIAGDGRGQTIALITADHDPTIAADLAMFDRQFGLAAPPSFTRVALPGATAINPIWSLETALDVEWAHAIAPGANLLLVEAPSANLGDLLSAADYARQQPGVSVVSMSWGSAEVSVETALDSFFTTPANHVGVAFVAASGDGGAAGALWPALSPNVLAVGGTQLGIDPIGDYLGETAWSGSAGGVSRYEGVPAAQAALTGIARRTAPDVSYNAATGFAVYTSITVAGYTGWMTTGGTSAGAPQWAALLAIADQGRALAGQGNLTDAVSAIDRLPASDFHDITTGSNGAQKAGPGYDEITGRGSPYADRVVAGLVPPPPASPPPAASPPPPAPPGISGSLLASRFSSFVHKTTASASAAVRLPSGDATFLGASFSATDVLRAMEDRSRRR